MQSLQTQNSDNSMLFIQYKYTMTVMVYNHNDTMAMMASNNSEYTMAKMDDGLKWVSSHSEGHRGHDGQQLQGGHHDGPHLGEFHHIKCTLQQLHHVGPPHGQGTMLISALNKVRVCTFNNMMASNHREDTVAKMEDTMMVLT